MTDMPRFQPPDASDEMVICQGCQRTVHYEQCHEDTNFCKECADCWCEDDVKYPDEQSTKTTHRIAKGLQSLWSNAVRRHFDGLGLRQ